MFDTDSITKSIRAYKGNREKALEELKSLEVKFVTYVNQLKEKHKAESGRQRDRIGEMCVQNSDIMRKNRIIKRNIEELEESVSFLEEVIDHLPSSPKKDYSLASPLSQSSAVSYKQWDEDASAKKGDCSPSFPFSQSSAAAKQSDQDKTNQLDKDETKKPDKDETKQPDKGETKQPHKGETKQPDARRISSVG